MSSPPVGRLAPSPTGHLHLGHARSFLLAWWSMRSQNGQLKLRLEDLDGPRVRKEFCDAIVEDLKWLGLSWDGIPTRQSDHKGAIQAAIASLEGRGLAYPCVCSRSNIRSAQSAPHGHEAIYPGTCRDRYASVLEAEQITGKVAGLRFRPQPGITVFEDSLAGVIQENVEDERGDFLIARRDGTAAYQLAVVVDDARQGVTEVLRGDDLLESTARQYLLQEALGYSHPRWIHVPLVLDENGERFAKRAHSVSLRKLRDRGVRPEVIVGWAARSLGMPCGRSLAPAEALPHFSIEKLSHDPYRLSAQELSQLGAVD
ncbi:MAG: tRNA glutamyl-Q(34) synthetase GluQRS [Polyangiaceae bacterium]|nr:tRNA glutamyl-Q(34) synthetase GluQRS [Polyangiaceae bacterium]